MRPLGECWLGWKSVRALLRAIWKNTETNSKDICISSFPAALFVVAKDWEEPRCPSRGHPFKKIRYTHVMQCYTVKNETDEAFYVPI